MLVKNGVDTLIGLARRDTVTVGLIPYSSMAKAQVKYKAGKMLENPSYKMTCLSRL